MALTISLNKSTPNKTTKSPKQWPSSFVLFIRQTMNRVITNRNEKNQKRLAAAKQGAEASAENAPEPLDKETKDADAEKDESKKGGD